MLTEILVVDVSASSALEDILATAGAVAVLDRHLDVAARTPHIVGAFLRVIDICVLNLQVVGQNRNREHDLTSAGR